jgi:GT2 family glycosyltransferase/glycosyltransferase involved in cell wall biosynthesis
MAPLHNRRLATGDRAEAPRVSIRRAVGIAVRSPRRALRGIARRGRSALHRSLGRVNRRFPLGGLRRPPTTSTRVDPQHAATRSVSRELDVESLQGHLDRLATRPPVTVVVPIHDAYDDVRRCLASLERNTSAHDAQVLLVDDASADPRVADLLDEWGRRSGVRTLRNDTNRGYTRTVNRAITACAGDVVLLNSDCEVTPLWLEHLVASAYRDPKIATVTAISDNAGAFSVPRIGVANGRPEHLTGDEVGRLVTRASQHVAPTTPTGNGFCMYIKRAALDGVGLFDAEAFPRGYGEEGDFCMRARGAGWVNVVDDSTMVFHRRSASFGAEKDELMQIGRQRLDARHPDYTRLIREFVKSEDLVRVQETVGAAYAESMSLARRPRPRILYVHHRGTGGTPETTADLMGALVDGYEPYLLTSDTRALELWRTEADGTELVERWVLPERIRPEQFTQPAYRAAVADILTRHAIDLVHIRVLLAHTFDLPSVARALDIPVVLSFHDYFLVCPTFHLLDESNRFCGGVCTPGDGACRIPSDWVRGVPHLKHAWVKEWQQAVARMLADCDAFVTTSATARDIYVRTYPQLADAPFHLIEHGRDLEFEPVEAVPDWRGPVRVVIPGAFDVHKGAPFIERLVELDAAGRLELHFLGNVPDEFRHLGVMHGPYERRQFTRKLHEIRPAFVGIFSIWAETYSHTLSEAWAVGVPVLVTDLGAPKERVEAHGGGWVLDHRDPVGAYRRIMEICDDPSEYRRVRGEVSLRGVRSLQEMADDYDALYGSVFLSRRAIKRQAEPRPSVIRVALFVVGSSTGRYAPTAHVRMLQRLGHPLVRHEIVAEPADVQAFIDGATTKPDLALVLRTAIPPDLTDGFLDAVRQRRIPLVVDLDDDLFDVDGRVDSYDYGAHQASLDRLVRAADLLTVSTGPLGQAMDERARRVAAVPNMLDEFLWFGGAGTTTGRVATRRSPEGVSRVLRKTAARRRPASVERTCNLVYVGTRTHADDLALLRPVIKQLRQRGDLEVTLFVVGGEERAPHGRGWYRSVQMPTTESHYAYPEFVPWVRSRSHDWTIAVAPLQEASFNRNKSDLKYLEYAALGLPAIYSDVVPYRDSVRHEVTGLLTENATEAWSAAILRLASDADLRARMAAEARAHVLRERCLRHGAADYAQLLGDVASSAAATV